VLDDLSIGSCASFYCPSCNGAGPKLSHILIRNVQGTILKKKKRQCMSEIVTVALRNQHKRGIAKTYSHLEPIYNRT
jgi:hypothetical protein